MSSTFRKQYEKGFLTVITDSSENEIEAPFCISKEDDIFIIEGILRNKKISYIIPQSIKCFFAIEEPIDSQNQ